jgi:hypothetical protein
MFQVNNNSSLNATRVPKASAHVFSQIIKTRQLPPEYLQIAGEISGNATEKNALLKSSTKSPSSADRCKGIIFSYSAIIFYVLLVAMTYSGHVFLS